MATNNDIYCQFRDASDRVESVPTFGSLKFSVRKAECWYGILSTCIIFLLIYAGAMFLLPSVGAEGLIMLIIGYGLPACVLLFVFDILIKYSVSKVVIDDEGIKYPESGYLAWDDIGQATLSDNIFRDDLIGLKKRYPQAYGTVELRFRRSDVHIEGQEREVHRILNSVTNSGQPLVLRILRERLGNRFTFPDNQ